MPNEYYNANAKQFFDGTVAVEMGALHERFLAKVRAGGRVLDAGCGSGRDAKAFAERGFEVAAFDASEALARMATAHCGFRVEVRTFAEVEEVGAYDGIWCCASLLHVAGAEMAGTIGRLWRALRGGGCLYFSFKLGRGEREVGGRRFTDADEETVGRWVEGLAEVQGVEVWVTDDQRAERSEKWINALVAKAGERRKLVVGGDDPFLPHLSRAMARATDVDIAVAFIKTGGLRLLMDDLLACVGGGERAPARVRVLTSDYLDITDPDALRLLLLLKERGAAVRVFATRGTSFHLKAYVFARMAQGELVEGTAFIGSSNISLQALQQGIEWNYRVAYPGDAGFLEARQRFEELFRHPGTVELRDDWIEEYERRRTPPAKAIAPGSHEVEAPPEPTSVQLRALEQLAATREAGYRRGLVALATGLGKTWLAAFDAKQMGARRVLFVAHREEILEQAAQTFLRIRPRDRVGFYMGQSRDASVDVLCASVQTLSRGSHLEKFSPRHFDYVVVDEFHHAAAGTYRRLLGHFAPAFLLGLTATPERTDQSDILSLCDDNQVFTCNLFDGVRAGLLAPFHYYGIADESVDYEEIPWRSGRFAPEALSSKLATLARARHALKVWQEKAQKRTMAFCVSISHAEFMAAQFEKQGVRAAAVYAGSSIGRSEALEDLREGRLSVIFSVDLFNEGVDLPNIDTILMLRPTESKILFLQQLGRGLRRAEGKEHLMVLDFIGNHHSFLNKPQALFGVGATGRALAEFALRASEQRLDLPEGCFVNYDPVLIDFLKALDNSGPRREYEALKVSLGRRPSLTEFYRAGASVRQLRQQHESWFQLVESAEELDDRAHRVLAALRPFLKELEITPMTRSFKMVLLEAFLEIDGLSKAPTLEVLAARSREVLERRKSLLSDLSAEMLEESAASPKWRSYWRENPVNAWIGGNRRPALASYFRVEAGKLEFVVPIQPEDHDSATDLIQEIVDYRLASYEVRRPQAEAGKILQLKLPARKSIEVPYFPNLKIACGHFKTGRTDSEEHLSLPERFGHLDAQRHFIARASGNSMNGGKNPIRDGDYLLMEHVTSTTPGQVMALERHQDVGGENQYVLRQVLGDATTGFKLRAFNPEYSDLEATADMRPVARLREILDPLDLRIGEAFMREDIPALFGETFNPGSWQVGHVVLNEKKIHVLLVTLNKQGKAEEHRYHDRWIDERTFHWQTQNSTTPESKRGQEIIHHEARGIALHLFVRDHKLSAGRAAPFTYHGEVAYKSHDGSGPMSVTFTL